MVKKKMGGQTGKELRPSSWLIGMGDPCVGGLLGLDNVLRNGGLRRPGGIMIELVEVRSPLNEVKKGRGNEGPGIIMLPK